MKDGAAWRLSRFFVAMKILNEEFMELLVIALAQRVYELEQRLETLEEELDADYDWQRTARAGC